MKFHVMCAFLAVATPLAAFAQEAECAYASSGAPPPTADACSEDPLHLGDDARLRAARAGLGLAEAAIVFKGCANGPFLTRRLGASAAARRYEITYPVLMGESSDRYVAPITHELGHVLQLEVAGSPAALAAMLTPLQRELGADFLAGLVLRNYIRDFRPSLFQENLSLTGNYCESNSDAHGSPEQRIAAFRSGLYLNYDALGRDPRAAHTHFMERLLRE